MGPPLQEGFADLLGLDPAAVQVAVAAFRVDYAATGLGDFDVYPGVPEMLAQLSAAGLRLAVATSKPESFALTVLAQAGLLAAVESVHGATLDGTVRHKARRHRRPELRNGLPRRWLGLRHPRRTASGHLLQAWTGPNRAEESGDRCRHSPGTLAIAEAAVSPEDTLANRRRDRRWRGVDF